MSEEFDNARIIIDVLAEIEEKKCRGRVEIVGRSKNPQAQSLTYKKGRVLILNSD